MITLSHICNESEEVERTGITCIDRKALRQKKNVILMGEEMCMLRLHSKHRYLYVHLRLKAFDRGNRK